VALFPTLKLDSYLQRALLMGAAAFAALIIDFGTKHALVALEPQTLLFNVSDRSPFGLGSSLIFVLVACTLGACVLPARFIALAAGVALGGALGNLTSRYWWSDRGGSPDFIRFGDGSTGNVADLFIFFGGLATFFGALVWLIWTILGSEGLSFGRRSS
jgi:ABC-type enterobactin transport system permease subunit